MKTEEAATALTIEKPLPVKPDKSAIFAAVRDNFLRSHLAADSTGRGEPTTKSGINEREEETISSPPSIITRAGAPETFSGMPLEVNWAITKMCNYTCSYCFGQDKLDRSRFTSLPYLKKAVDHIAELHRDTVRFTFGGGEPTTHPDLGELIEYAHRIFGKRLESVLVISNGSRNQKLYETLARNAEIDRVRFNISLHTEFMELDHIISLVKLLSHKIPLSLNLMFNPLKKEFCRTIHQKLCVLRSAYPFTLHVIFIRKRPKFARLDDRYVPQDIEWQKQAMEEFEKVAVNGPQIPYPTQRGYSGAPFWNYADPSCPYKKMEGTDRDIMFVEGNFNFKGMYCIPGSSLVCIDPDGTVYGARACPQASILYNIFQENPYRHNDFIRPVRCTSPNCGCSTNDQLPKFLSSEEAEDFAEMYRFRQAKRMAE
ncbi:MAG: radical SAM protein [Desulfovibrio sp.]|nr:radical SAM protein [Desulfovibrio sp.]